MSIRSLSRRLFTLLRHKTTVTNSPSGSRWRRNVTKVFIGAQFASFAAVSAGGVKLSDPDPGEVSHSYLIRNATIGSLTSATTVFVHTLSSLLASMEEYNESLLELMHLYELSLEVMGEHVQEERVWDGILQERAKLNKRRQQKQELQTMLNCAQKVVEAASEAAFMAGAEYASISASELLHSSSLHYRSAVEATEALEERLIAVEVKSIEEMSRREAPPPPQDIATLEDLDEIVTNPPQFNEEQVHEIVIEKDEQLKEGDDIVGEKKEGLEGQKPEEVKQEVKEETKKEVTEVKEEVEDDLKNWFDFGKEKYKVEEEKEMKDPYRDTL